MNVALKHYFTMKKIMLFVVFSNVFYKNKTKLNTKTSVLAIRILFWGSICQSDGGITNRF